MARTVHSVRMESHYEHEVAKPPADKQSDSLSANDRYALQALARDMGAELASVRQLYERELTQLEANAKVKGFLSVLAGRKVRLALCAHRAADSGSQHSAHAA
jgi:hypothetical protein